MWYPPELKKAKEALHRLEERNFFPANHETVAYESALVQAQAAVAQAEILAVWLDKQFPVAYAPPKDEGSHPLHSLRDKD